MHLIKLGKVWASAPLTGQSIQVVDGGDAAAAAGVNLAEVEHVHGIDQPSVDN